VPSQEARGLAKADAPGDAQERAGGEGSPSLPGSGLVADEGVTLRIEHLRDVVTEELRHDVLGLRALNLDRPEPPRGSSPQARSPRATPSAQSSASLSASESQKRSSPSRSNTGPSMIPPSGAVTEHVLALPGLALGEIPRDEQVRKGERVRPGDLDLALNAHGPEGRRLVESRVMQRLGNARGSGPRGGRRCGGWRLSERCGLWVL
jgi:hypothetical protein